MMVDDVEARLQTHEAVCAERYDSINARLKRLEGILIGAAGAIILALLGIVMQISTWQ
jgi:hypothetical protein